jgi:hypothetical protein
MFMKGLLIGLLIAFLVVVLFLRMQLVHVPGGTSVAVDIRPLGRFLGGVILGVGLVATVIAGGLAFARYCSTLLR